MGISGSIRRKFFFFFLFMGGVPFIVLIFVGAANSKWDLESGIRQTSSLRNAIISEHVTELVEKNMAVLHSLALTPAVIHYVHSGDEAYRAMAEKLCRDTNTIFKDENNLALTARSAFQIFRTDGATLVNVSNRAHFQEAMKGREYVTDILASKSTGKMIVVMEVPVLNLSGEPIGMVQRNFDLVALQEFVLNLDDSESSIIVMDRTGRVIVNSDQLEGVGSEYVVDPLYKSLLDKIYNSSGVIDMELEGEKCMAAYSRNLRTGWMILTIRPYRFIWEQLLDKIVHALILGLFLLTVVGVLAWTLSFQVAEPIKKISDAVGKIASGEEIESMGVEVSGNDELGQMAAAFNKIRTERERLVENLGKVKVERDDFKLASELDKLTELFNKATMANLCRMKLSAFNANNLPNIYMALYVIDLDHFKEVNDSLGHQFGDKVLVEFAGGLRKIFRTNDCIGRFGGDEFVAIIDNLPNLDVAWRKAEQIKKLAFNLTVEGKTHFVTASIGIAIAPYEGRDYETLFKSADEAVYRVKNSGKNGYYCKYLDDI